MGIHAVSPDAYHNRSLRMQLRTVWCLRLIGDTEGPTLITGATWLRGILPLCLLGTPTTILTNTEDDYEALKEFNHAYEGNRSAIEDMHLEYQSLLQSDSELDARLKSLPGATFSGRKRIGKNESAVFFCYALPALDKELGEFTEEAGTTRWYLCDFNRDVILDHPGEIVESIRSKPNTPRRCVTEEKTLIDLKTKVEKHIKNTYLKRVDAPLGVKPALKCWMELNEG